VACDSLKSTNNGINDNPKATNEKRIFPINMNSKFEKNIAHKDHKVTTTINFLYASKALSEKTKALLIF
jgi:hypothetical protein